MAWFKVDDGFHASRKLLQIPKRARYAAVGLWTIAGSWCADQLTDGFIPDYMIRELGAPPSAPESLVRAGLWERTQAGYVFCNWHEYQPSKQDVDTERAASRARMRELRAKRKGVKPQNDAENGEVFGRTGPNGSENVRNPDPVPTQSRPSPHKEPKGSLDASMKMRDDFIDWYAEYPRKAGRAAAEKAYVKAREKASAETMLAGAKSYASDPNRSPEFTKLPATWLNAGCWDDDPLPARGEARLSGAEQRLQEGLARLARNESGQRELGA